MAFLALVAVVGLAASGASATCIADGSSAVSDMILALTGSVTGGTVLGVTPSTPPGALNKCDQSAKPFCYQTNGSGAGRAWIKAGTGPLAFSDNSYAGAVISGSGAGTVYKNGPLPSTVAEFPIALGAIAWYRNPVASIPLTACLKLSQMCKVFTDGAVPRAATYNDLDASWPAVPIVPVIRSESSGSTDAVVAYMKQICPANWNFAKVTTPGVYSFRGTSGVANAVATGTGFTTIPAGIRTGYAVCGRKANGPLAEWALQNRRGNCVKCAQCLATTPAPGAQCGIYSQFKIQNRLCSWSGTPPNGDKDADSDEVIDLDNDGDGVGPQDYPTVFLEYAMMPVTVPAAQKTCCAFFQRMLAFLLNSNTQKRMPTFGFFPLPPNVLTNACACMAKRTCGLNFAGIYAAGTCR